MIRLLLVDDQSIVRQGLRMRLMMEPDIVVIGEASSGEQALELVQVLSPDIVLMDVEMPGMDGITATTALRASTLKSAVVMMSIHDDAQTRARAQAAGAAAFVEKSGTLEELLATVRHIVKITETETPGTITLNCYGLEPINSPGICLLIQLLIYTKRQQKRLQVLGLSKHNRYIFEITRLNKFMNIVEPENQTVATIHRSE